MIYPADFDEGELLSLGLCPENFAPIEDVSEDEPVEKEIETDIHPLFNLLFGTASSFRVERVIFHEPATIVVWEDGSKTVVKCREGDVFNEMTGLALCFMKKACEGDFHRVLKKFIPNYGNKITLDLIKPPRKKIEKAKPAEPPKITGRKSNLDDGKIMALWRANWTAEAIAEEMDVSVNTIRKHLRAMRNEKASV